MGCRQLGVPKRVLVGDKRQEDEGVAVGDECLDDDWGGTVT